MRLRRRLAEIRAVLPPEERKAIGRRAVRGAIGPTLAIVGFCFAASTFVFALSGFRETAEYGRKLLFMLLVLAPLVYGVAFMHAAGREYDRGGHSPTPKGGAGGA
jgi:peptidoglycan/LPS O-acetylase OafA/YrhL